VNCKLLLLNFTAHHGGQIDPGALYSYVGFVVDKEKFGLFSLRILRYLAVSIIPPVRHMHITFTKIFNK